MQLTGQESAGQQGNTGQHQNDTQIQHLLGTSSTANSVHSTVLANDTLLTLVRATTRALCTSDVVGHLTQLLGCCITPTAIICMACSHNMDTTCPPLLSPTPRADTPQKQEQLGLTDCCLQVILCVEPLCKHPAATMVGFNPARQQATQ